MVYGMHLKLAGTMLYAATSLFLALGAGCVVPPPIDVDTTDGGGTNHPPRLRWDVTLPRLGDKSLTVHQTATGKPAVTQPFSVAFVDVDRQVVSVRFFINKNYKSAIADRQSPVPSDDFNGVFIEIPGLCDQYVNSVIDNYDLEVYISDKGFVDKGDDLRVINPGGYRDNGHWTLVCKAPEG